MSLSNWESPQSSLLPDFIIGGAMKSGTSTLHAILNKHPKIFIPEQEIHFFDIDNILQHSDFNFFDKKNNRWIYQMMQKDPAKMWDWYFKKFEEGRNNIKGEDSTTYLASQRAAERISIQDKNIKLIFLLRHPTARAYSQYYHMLKTGRAIYDFENTIRFQPDSILERSLYKDQLQYWYDNMNNDQIKIILFEEFIVNTRETVKEVCSFLSINFNEFDESAFTTHTNKTMLPRNISMQITFNRMFRELGNTYYLNSLPYAPNRKPNKRSNQLFMFLKKLHRYLNPLNQKKSQEMNHSTKAMLDDFFYVQLRGINRLTGRDILSVWFG